MQGPCIWASIYIYIGHRFDQNASLLPTDGQTEQAANSTQPSAAPQSVRERPRTDPSSKHVVYKVKNESR